MLIRKTFRVFIILYLFTHVSCITNSNLEDSLDGIPINKIEVLDGKVFFCTDDGIYLKKGEDFLAFGLKGNRILDITRINGNSYLAAKAIQYDVFAGEITLFKKQRGTWLPYMGDFGGEGGKYTWVNQLLSTEENPSVIYASGGTNVLKSKNGGKNWIEARFTWDALGRTWFLENQPGQENTIWAGGIAAVPVPYLARSTNGGETWQNFRTIEFTEGTNYDIAFNPSDMDQIMVSLGGGIRRSIDFGESWTTVLQAPYVFYTMTPSARDASVIYASGEAFQNRQLFLFRTEDFGDSWQEIEVDTTIQDVYVNDMVSILEDGREIIYFGTNKGVFTHEVVN